MKYQLRGPRVWDSSNGRMVELRIPIDVSSFAKVKEQATRILADYAEAPYCNQFVLMPVESVPKTQ